MMLVAFLIAIIQQALSESDFDDEFMWLETQEIDLTSIDTSAAWENWKVRFGKSYENATYDEEAYDIWLENWYDVNEHNKNVTKTHSQRLNQYSDLSSAEFLSSVVGLDVSNTFEGESYSATSDVVPDSIDWRDYNGKSYVTPVKNQGQCGSCWSFATTGVMESRYAVESGGTLTSLSEQELVSCYAGNCNGNTYFGAMNWVATNGGLCSEAAYPYTSGTGSVAACNSACGTKYDALTAPGYETITKFDEDALKTALADGPVAVGVDASPPFGSYAGGILTDNCGTGINHAVLAVGYGSEAGVDYWIIKNSWGAGWGESGYIRICRNCNQNLINDLNYGQCGILSYTPAIPVFTNVITVKGCMDEAHKIEVIADKIYACKGTFSGGVSGGEALCSDGYSICASDSQTSGLGLTQALCTSSSIFTSTSEFYATLQSSQGNSLCTQTGTNDIWGCANGAVTNMYGTPCGSLRWRIGGSNMNAPSYWSWSDDWTESSTASLSNIVGGGVLCCKEGIGCRDASNQVEVVADKIYGCAGAFSGGINHGGQELCAQGYEVCQSASMAESLGLTADLCSSTTIFSTPNVFYATAQSSNGDFICAGSGYNDIWGCASSDSDASADATASVDVFKDHECGVLQYIIGDTGPTIGAPDGWSFNSDTTESSTASLSTRNGGGVLCCSIAQRLNAESNEYFSQCNIDFGNDTDTDTDESKAYSFSYYSYIFAQICVFFLFFVVIS